MPRLDKVYPLLACLLHRIISYSAREVGISTDINSLVYISLTVSANEGNGINGIISVRCKKLIYAERRLYSCGEFLKARFRLKVTYSAEAIVSEGLDIRKTDKPCKNIVNAALDLIGSGME